MGQSTKTTEFLNKIIVAADFLILNILFAIYLRYDWSVMHYSNGVDTRLLYFFVNVGMMTGQYFYSNIVHKRIIHSGIIIRQVTMLTITFTISSYLVQKAVLAWYGIPSPMATFIPCFAVILYFGLIIIRIIERYSIKKIRSFKRNTSTALFVGSDFALMPIYSQLMSDMSLGYNVLGYYSDEKIRKEYADEGFVHIGNLDDLARLINENDQRLKVDEIYCSLRDDNEDIIRSIMHYCDNNIVHFYFIPAFTNTFGFNLKAGNVGDTVVFTNYDTPLTSVSARILKRTFDIFVSSIICLIVLVITPIIAIIIKLQSPGPIFFRQKRTGLGGKDFICYKFRSMHVNKEADKLQATEHDPRKFAFGNFMRKSNIDELPQFFCVLKGDMSIVGPRPHMLAHTEMYSALIDKYMVRHFVKPGITGWAQVTGFRGETKELRQMEGRVRKDIWYIEHWTFWLDISIIFKTAKQIIIHDEHAY
ncbi:MAG: exopolysaccharide biosynthesis polyprenyl glycosylphosphotransferase [Prevotella sp.]|nr:exopolysaccharide biosynthesis polyprenyl glycosylphosphotransferase [Prevotella sp.]